jgi:hypothetical protein
MDFARVPRHRYIIEDPGRFGCLLAAAALLFVQDIPFWLTLAVVGVTQLAPVLMAGRAMGAGWSRRWGPRAHASVFASNLSLDFTNLCACALVGALLLVRHFNGVEVVKPLALLTVAVVFLPDVGLCRWLLAGDPVEASRQLRSGLFFRDPVMLASMLASGVLCVLDHGSLRFVMYSLMLLQFNALLVIVDKYLPEIESREHSGWKVLVLEREGRRLTLALLPLLLVPLRLAAGDRAAWFGAGLIAAAVMVPDLWRGLRNLFDGVLPASPRATYIVVPRD